MVHLAATQGHLDFLRMAADHGANFDTRNFFGGHPSYGLGFSPVDMNYRHSPMEVFHFLLDNGLVKDINIPAEPPLTVPGFIFRFMMFVFRMKFRFRRLQGPKALANLDPVILALATTKSSTMLHYICANGGSTELLEFLLEKKADPTRKNALGQTPLDIAVIERHAAQESILRQALQSTQCDDSSAGKSTKAVPWSRKMTSLLGRSTRDKVLP